MDKSRTCLSSRRDICGAVMRASACFVWTGELSSLPPPWQSGEAVLQSLRFRLASRMHWNFDPLPESSLISTRCEPFVFLMHASVCHVWVVELTAVRLLVFDFTGNFVSFGDAHLSKIENRNFSTTGPVRGHVRSFTSTGCDHFFLAQIYPLHLIVAASLAAQAW